MEEDEIEFIGHILRGVGVVLVVVTIGLIWVALGGYVHDNLSDTMFLLFISGSGVLLYVIGEAVRRIPDWYSTS